MATETKNVSGEPWRRILTWWDIIFQENQELTNLENEMGVKRARDRNLSRDELIKLSVQADGEAVYAQFLTQFYDQSTINFKTVYTQFSK